MDNRQREVLKMASPNSSESLQDATIRDLGFAGPDRYDLVRIFRDGGPANDRDSHLLGEYERRDALTRNWYHEDRAADAKRNLIAVLVVGISVIVLLLMWTILI